MRPTVAVVPLRDGRSGKTRLAAGLVADDRARLVADLARHVVTTLLASDGVERVVVVTADPGFAHATLDDVRGRLHVLAQPSGRPGLNASLDVAREHVVAAEPEARLLVVHGDLPALTRDDVAAVLGAASGGAAPPVSVPGAGAPVVLAPDRAGTGTNALLLSPTTAGFAFRFGVGSRAAHHAEAERRGLAWVEVDRPGTAVDLDTPEDWALLPEAVRGRVLAAVPAMARLPLARRAGPPG